MNGQAMSTTMPLAAERPRAFIAGMVALVCVATTFLMATPGFAILIASQWGYGAAQIGLFVTAESIGNALGPLVLSGLLSRRPVRRTLLLSALAFALANLGTALRPDDTAVLMLRGLSGFSSGILAGLGVRYLALSAKAERNLTALVISQTLYSTLLLALLLPMVGERWQATGAFGLLALQALLSVPMVLLFVRGERLTPEAVAGSTVDKPRALAGLLALVGLNTAVGVVWTFIGHQGQDAGLGMEAVDRILAACNVASIFTCAAVPAAIRGGGLFRWAVITLGACAAAALLLGVGQGVPAFVGGSLLFVAAWSAAATLLMAAVPLYDQTGRFVMLIPSALCIGNALGAAVGGVLMEHAGPVPAFGFAALCCLAAAALFALLRFKKTLP